MNITGNKCFALIDNSTVYAGDCVKLKYFNNKGEELKEDDESLFRVWFDII